MIKIIRPGIPKYEYTNTCSECMCMYSYHNEDIKHDYSLTISTTPYIICPCCGAKNPIYNYITPAKPYEYWKITCDNTEMNSYMNMLKIVEGDCDE